MSGRDAEDDTVLDMEMIGEQRQLPKPEELYADVEAAIFEMDNHNPALLDDDLESLEEQDESPGNDCLAPIRKALRLDDIWYQRKGEEVRKITHVWSMFRRRDADSKYEFRWRAKRAFSPRVRSRLERLYKTYAWLIEMVTHNFIAKGFLEWAIGTEGLFRRYWKMKKMDGKSTKAPLSMENPEIDIDATIEKIVGKMESTSYESNPGVLHEIQMTLLWMDAGNGDLAIQEKALPDYMEQKARHKWAQKKLSDVKADVATRLHGDDIATRILDMIDEGDDEEEEAEFGLIDVDLSTPPDALFDFVKTLIVKIDSLELNPLLWELQSKLQLSPSLMKELGFVKKDHNSEYEFPPLRWQKRNTFGAMTALDEQDIMREIQGYELMYRAYDIAVTYLIHDLIVKYFIPKMISNGHLHDDWILTNELPRKVDMKRTIESIEQRLSSYSTFYDGESVAFVIRTLAWLREDPQREDPNIFNELTEEQLADAEQVWNMIKNRFTPIRFDPGNVLWNLFFEEALATDTMPTDKDMTKEWEHDFDQKYEIISKIPPEERGLSLDERKKLRKRRLIERRRAKPIPDNVIRAFLQIEYHIPKELEVDDPENVVNMYLKSIGKRPKWRNISNVMLSRTGEPFEEVERVIQSFANQVAEEEDVREAREMAQWEEKQQRKKESGILFRFLDPDLALKRLGGDVRGDVDIDEEESIAEGRDDAFMQLVDYIYEAGHQFFATYAGSTPFMAKTLEALGLTVDDFKRKGADRKARIRAGYPNSTYQNALTAYVILLRRYYMGLLRLIIIPWLVNNDHIPVEEDDDKEVETKGEEEEEADPKKSQSKKAKKEQLIDRLKRRIRKKYLPLKNDQVKADKLLSEFVLFYLSTGNGDPNLTFSKEIEGGVTFSSSNEMKDEAASMYQKLSANFRKLFKKKDLKKTWATFWDKHRDDDIVFTQEELDMLDKDTQAHSPSSILMTLKKRTKRTERSPTLSPGILRQFIVERLGSSAATDFEGVKEQVIFADFCRISDEIYDQLFLMGDPTTAIEFGIAYERKGKNFPAVEVPRMLSYHIVKQLLLADYESIKKNLSGAYGKIQKQFSILLHDFVIHLRRRVERTIIRKFEEKARTAAGKSDQELKVLVPIYVKLTFSNPLERMQRLFEEKKRVKGAKFSLRDAIVAWGKENAHLFREFPSEPALAVQFSPQKTAQTPAKRRRRISPGKEDEPGPGTPAARRPDDASDPVTPVWTGEHDGSKAEEDSRLQQQPTKTRTRLQQQPTETRMKLGTRLRGSTSCGVTPTKPVLCICTQCGKLSII